jgi:hypothetical protein
LHKIVKVADCDREDVVPPGQAQDVTKHRPVKTALIPVERIERTIVRLRGHNVMCDADLADLYGVTTRRLNEQVKRNVRRFPVDFMFQLTAEEYAGLRSQIATSSSTVHGGRRHLPFVFTEHGAIMAASVLNSRRAVQMSILVVRAFVGLRQFLRSNAALAKKIKGLERKYVGSSMSCFKRSASSWRRRRCRGSGSVSARPQPLDSNRLCGSDSPEQSSVQKTVARVERASCRTRSCCPR